MYSNLFLEIQNKQMLYSFLIESRYFLCYNQVNLIK